MRQTELHSIYNPGNHQREKNFRRRRDSAYLLGKRCHTNASGLLSLPKNYTQDLVSTKISRTGCTSKTEFISWKLRCIFARYIFNFTFSKLDPAQCGRIKEVRLWKHTDHVAGYLRKKKKSKRKKRRGVSILYTGHPLNSCAQAVAACP